MSRQTHRDWRLRERERNRDELTAARASEIAKDHNEASSKTGEANLNEEERDKK